VVATRGVLVPKRTRSPGSDSDVLVVVSDILHGRVDESSTGGSVAATELRDKSLGCT
jgi:hypothetical protein